MTLGDADINLGTMSQAQCEKLTSQEKEQKAKGNGLPGDMTKPLTQVLSDPAIPLDLSC